jgi:hypothetical protein
MKITKSQLKEIIKEEVSRLQKKTILENRKKEIVRELRTLNEDASELLVYKMENGKKTNDIVGTHQYGKGFIPNELGKKLGLEPHPTSIPNQTIIDRSENETGNLDELFGMGKAKKAANHPMNESRVDRAQLVKYIFDNNIDVDPDFEDNMSIGELEKIVRNHKMYSTDEVGYGDSLADEEIEDISIVDKGYENPQSKGIEPYRPTTKKDEEKRKREGFASQLPDQWKEGEDGMLYYIGKGAWETVDSFEMGHETQEEKMRYRKPDHISWKDEEVENNYEDEYPEDNEDQGGNEDTFGVDPSVFEPAGAFDGPSYEDRLADIDMYGDELNESEIGSQFKEEVSRLQKKTILENRKKAIIRELSMLSENIGEEEMEFLKTVKSTTPELYNKYINKVKRQGLDVAVRDFYPHTEEGQKEKHDAEKQGRRDAEKQERLDDENQKIDEVLSMVSQKEMFEYMAEWRSRMLDGEHVNDAPNKRFHREKDFNLALLAQAYIKAHGLDDSLISKVRIAWDNEDELSAFDDLRDFIRSARTQKLFDRKFNIKFRQIISEFL